MLNGSDQFVRWLLPPAASGMTLSLDIPYSVALFIGVPSVRFTDDADLNRQALEWYDGVGNRRVRGTTGRRPWEMLAEERLIGVNYYCRCATTIVAGSAPPVDCVVGPRRCGSWARRIPG